MSRNTNKTPSVEDIAGLTVLPELNAMARVGIMSAGSRFQVARAKQLTRSAERAAKQGDTTRAEALQRKAAAVFGTRDALAGRAQVEIGREIVVPQGTHVIQGQVAESGHGKAGLRVDLVDEKGVTLADAVTAASGHFTIKTTAASAGTARLVLSDGQGAIVSSIPAAAVTKGFVTVDLSEAVPTKKPDFPPSPELLLVPDMRSMLASEAREKLIDRGFDVLIEDLPTRAAAPGFVMAQTPEGMSRHPGGTTVTLSVAVPAKVELPSVLGLTLEQAGTSLGLLGLAVEAVADPSSPRKNGEVAEQTPGAGALVAQGSGVLLVYSTRNPDAPSVPTGADMISLVGKTHTAAWGALEKAGLAVAAPVFAYERAKSGKVVAQTPASGVKIGQGEAVQLTIGVARAKADAATLIAALKLDQRIREAAIPSKVMNAFQKRAKSGDWAKAAAFAEASSTDMVAAFKDMTPPQAEVILKVMSELVPQIAEAREG